MCGRFAQSGPVDLLARIYDAEIDPIVSDFRGSWNVAPTRDVLTLVAQDGEDKRSLTSMSWGYSPAWAQHSGFKHRPINARCETVEEKRMFSGSLKARRCAVGVDGWYEWTTTATGKQPHYFHHRDGEPLALAGIWTADATGRKTFALLTQKSSGVLSEVHDRMPLLIPNDALQAWLEPIGDLAAGMLEALRTARDEMIETVAIHLVSREVNSVANDGSHLISQMS